jgi:hypothetical protein
MNRYEKTYVRKGEGVPVHIILPMIPVKKFLNKGLRLLNGVFVKTNGLRMQTFRTHGVRCHECGLEGKYFRVEKGKTEKSKARYFHLNLYGINKSGHEVMLTCDHIIPKKWGGRNKIYNTQTMCIHCNEKKRSKIVLPDIEYHEYLHTYAGVFCE